MANTLLSNIVAPSAIVTLTGTQSLTNKTLASPVITGTITAGGGVGTSGQILSSTGTGVQWITTSAGSSGTVTSITAGTGLSGGTITTTGTIALATAYGDTTNPYASKTANYVLAAPNGTAGVPSFRALVAADIPTLNQNTTGSAATLTTPRAIYGNNFDGSAALTQVIAGTYGGTGVNNGSNTLTLAGNVSHAGSFTQTFTATANTSVTLPTTGTLATLAGSETFTNKTLTSPTINSATVNNATITGTLTANSSAGTNGYFLQSTGTGVQWAQATSTSVFTANAQSDLGYVYDSVVLTEDLGTPLGTTTTSYDLAVLNVGGVVSLSNLDSTVKSDYLAQAIIFGF